MKKLILQNFTLNKSKLPYFLLITLAGSYFSIKDGNNSAIIAVSLIIALKTAFTDEIHNTKSRLSKLIFSDMVLAVALGIFIVLSSVHNPVNFTEYFYSSIIIMIICTIYSITVMAVFEKYNYTPRSYGMGLFTLIIFLVAISFI